MKFKLTEEQEEKLSKGMKVKPIREHNQKQKFSENMERIIAKQKRKAGFFHQHKKTTCFENRRKKRMVKATNGIQVSKENVKFFIRNLNVVIDNREAIMIKNDSLKQYK